MRCSEWIIFLTDCGITVFGFNNIACKLFIHTYKKHSGEVQKMTVSHNFFIPLLSGHHVQLNLCLAAFLLLINFQSIFIMRGVR